jgi:hypothetical protein
MSCHVAREGELSALRLAILLSLSVTLDLFLSLWFPVPEKVARLVFSEDTLKVPDHCGQTNR